MSRIAHIPAIACLLALVMMASASPARQNLPDGPGEGAGRRDALRYATCMRRAREDPEKALTLAGEWQEHGGGPPAEHCIAVAMFHQERFTEAARHLTGLAEDIRAGRTGGIFDPAADTARWKELIPDLHSQAGNAWLAADRPENAKAAFDRAIEELAGREQPPEGQHADMLIDRARALAATEDYRSALADLETAWRLSGDRADLHLYRASALRRLGRLDDARDAADQALAMAPDMPAALLERGNIRQLAGDGKGAREDWMAVLSAAPGSAAAKAAQKNLAQQGLSENDDARSGQKPATPDEDKD